jgi:hypothetical protein
MAFVNMLAMETLFQKFEALETTFLIFCRQISFGKGTSYRHIGTSEASDFDAALLT